MKYALFGATGAVGKALAPVLASANMQFRVVGRSLERLRREFAQYEPLAELHAADLADPHAAKAAADGIDTLFYLVGVPYTNFGEHPRLTRIAVEAATASGVRRFVHVSTVYPYGKPQRDLVDESHPREPHTFKGKMRKEQEDLVFAADGKNGMRITILRPPDFYGPTAELSYARSMFEAAVDGGTANVIGPIDTPHEFIFVPDLARTLFALSGKDEAYGQAWNVAGPGLITTRQFAELVFAAAGKKPRLRIANKTMLRVLGLFNPFFREVLEMHYLWTTPVALDDRRLHDLLPGLSKTSYEDGIKETLRVMRSAPGSSKQAS
jgi:nucleoside-diphosphate-sugar epimerase